MATHIQSEDQSGDISHTEEQISLEAVKHRSFVGVLSFVGRTALLQILAFVAVFFLTIFLTPQEYGIFYIVEATVAILVYFSDIGLGAALIQKKSKVTPTDLSTTFFIQQALVITLVSISFILSKTVSDFYGFSGEALLLFRVLLVAFFLSTLKTIPSLLLERDLEFDKLVIPQIVETIIFYATAVYCAWMGLGIVSFVYAVALRSVTGLVLMYLIKPWFPKILFSKESAKELVNFGAPFQLMSILALVKDRLLVIYTGKVLSFEQIGYLGFAERYALMPQRLIADPILRVTFPAFARLQDDKKSLKKAIEKSIFFVSLLVFPAVMGLLVLAPILVNQIPKYEKWQPALVALTFYGINALFSSISITLTNTLNATGGVKTTLKLMVMWTVLTWIFTPLFIHWFSFNGVAIASALTASSSMIAYYLVNKIVKIKFFEQILPALVSTIIMSVGLWIIAPYWADSLIKTLQLVLLGGIIYLISLLVFFQVKMKNELSILNKYLKK